MDADVWACARVGNVPALCDLIDKHAVHVNSRDGAGRTPLHHAAQGGAELATDALLQRGAHVNALCAALNTPLHHALAGGHVSVAARLVRHGASAALQNLLRQTPLDRGRANGHGARVERLAPLIAEHRFLADKWLMEDLCAAAAAGALQHIAALAAAGASPNGRDSMGWTPLLHAVAGRQAASLLALAAAGADVGMAVVCALAPGARKQPVTAMRLAHACGWEVGVQQLLAIGAAWDDGLQLQQRTAREHVQRVGAPVAPSPAPSPLPLLLPLQPAEQRERRLRTAPQ